MFSSKVLPLPLAFGLLCMLAQGQGPSSVLVVANDNSALSRNIAEYYVQKRAIPLKNFCHIRTSTEEGISRPDYDREIAGGVTKCLRQGSLVEQILYIATTGGVPLRIDGDGGLTGDVAAVDSELALLYADLNTGRPHPTKGWVVNPFFRKTDATFSHAQFPIYLVTRLAAYDFPGVRAMIDRSLQATNRGKFVVDVKTDDFEMGNDWLRDAAIRLPADRVIYDTTTKVIYKQTDVIGYAGWGSNDFNRHERYLGFQWLPGAIATEFVSTNGRTFARPPKDWNISDWGILSRLKWFAGSPQTMTADYLDEGASAATGHVAEPYLTATPRPDYLLPAYFKGRTLAESYYLSLPYLSWQNIMAGDPLMSLK